jgi:vancomycin resistance protein YoaR
METYVNTSAQRITWKFYSTKDGRTVDWTTTGPVNIVPAPEPLFQENPDLSVGEMNQVDWAADGADVTVTRTVTRGGVILSNDTFRTHYLPWQAICDYGPGTDDWVGLASSLGLCQAP